MFLEQLASVLQTAGVGTVAQNIFVHAAPTDVDNYVLLKYGPMGVPIDWYLPGYYDVTFQVIIRNVDYTNGFAVSDSVVSALTIFQETVIDNYTFKQVYPNSQPHPYRRGDAGIIEFNVMFKAYFVKQ